MEWSQSGHTYLVLMEAGEEGSGKMPRLALNQKTDEAEGTSGWLQGMLGPQQHGPVGPTGLMEGLLPLHTAAPRPASSPQNSSGYIFKTCDITLLVCSMVPSVFPHYLQNRIQTPIDGHNYT